MGVCQPWTSSFVCWTVLKLTLAIGGMTPLLLADSSSESERGWVCIKGGQSQPVPTHSSLHPRLSGQATPIGEPAGTFALDFSF